MIEVGEDYLRHIPISSIKLVVEDDYFINGDLIKFDAPSIFISVANPVKLENGCYELTLRPVGKQTCRYKSHFYDDKMESELGKLSYKIEKIRKDEH